MKIQASARGSRSGCTTPAAWHRETTSVTNSCTSRRWRRRNFRDLRLVAPLRKRLDPERRDGRLLLLERKNARAIAYIQARGSSSASSAACHGLPHPRPGALDARQIERLLRVEMPVEDRLGHSRLAGDLGGGRAAIATAGEDAAGGVQHGGPPLDSPEAAPSLRSSPFRPRATARARAGEPARTRRAQAANAIPAATCNAAWNPSTNCAGIRRAPGSRRSRTSRESRP